MQTDNHNPQKPRNYFHKVDLLEKVRKELSKVKSSKEELETILFQKEKIWNEDLESKDNLIASFRRDISELEISNQDLKTTFDSHLKASLSEIRLVFVSKEMDLESRYNQDKNAMQNEINELKKRAMELEDRMKGQSLEIAELHRVHKELLDNRTLELQDALSRLMFFEAAVRDKEHTLDKVMLEHKEVFDRLKAEIRVIQDDKSSLEIQHTAANRDRLRQQIRRFLEKASMKSERDCLGYGLNCWKRFIQCCGKEEVKKHISAISEANVRMRVRRVIERSILLSIRDRVSCAFREWKNVVDEEKNQEIIDKLNVKLVIVETSLKNKILTGIRDALHRRFMSLSKDQLLWGFCKWKDLHRDQEVQPENGGTTMALEKFQSRYIYHLYSANAIPSSMANTRNSSSSGPGCGCGFKKHTPVLDSLRKKYGFR